MINGLKYIVEGADNFTQVYADDENGREFDNEDDFIDNAPDYIKEGAKLYYFGGGDDGAMRTNKATIEIDGDNYNFYFEKSGSNKGAGKVGEHDDKYYLAGMLLKAGSDEKYQVIQKDADTTHGEIWTKIADAKDFLTEVGVVGDDDVTTAKITEAKGLYSSFNKGADDLKELYIVPKADRESGDYKLINTSGKVVEKKKSKDGNDYVYVTDSKGSVLFVYVED